MKNPNKTATPEPASPAPLAAPTPYISAGFDVGADFTWMSIALPNGTLLEKPYKIIHSDPDSRIRAVKKLKEAQNTYSLEVHCLLESTGIYHIPLLYFLRDEGFACQAINPIISKNSTNINIRKQHNDRVDSKKLALLGLSTDLKVSIIPEPAVTDLRNLVRDYYYFQDDQSAIVLKLTAELKVSFPEYRHVFCKLTTKTSLKLLDAYPLAADMLAAGKEAVEEIILHTARFGKKYASEKADAVIAAAKDAAIFGHSLSSNAIRIRAYIRQYNNLQETIDTLLQSLHEVVDGLEGSVLYDQISLLQSIPGIGFLSAVVLIAEMGSFDLFNSPKKLYAYFGLDPGVRQSGKFNSNKVHMSKRGSALARRVLHMIAINNLKVDKGSKEPVNPVIFEYYVQKCTSKQKQVAIGAVMHKICRIIFAVLRDNKPFEIITPEDHRKQYTSEHSGKVELAA